MELKIGGELVIFTKKKDVRQIIREGDIICCSVVYAGVFYYGRNLKLIEPSSSSSSSTDLPIETNLKFRYRVNLEAIGYRIASFNGLFMGSISTAWLILKLLLNSSVIFLNECIITMLTVIMYGCIASAIVMIACVIIIVIDHFIIKPIFRST